MTTELLNRAELAALISVVPVTEGHGDLLATLQRRYPGVPFRLVAARDGYSWGNGLIDRNGTRVADDLAAWVDRELAAAGGDAREVWRRNVAAGLIRTAWKGEYLTIAVPFGPEPDAFQQIGIRAGAESTVQAFLDIDEAFAPEDRGDLLSGPCLVFGPHEQQVLSPLRYTLDGMTNIRRFLRDLLETEKANRLAELPELQQKTIRIQEVVPGPDGSQTSCNVPFLDLCPDWLERIPPAIRFFRDWQESSAGRAGHRLCEHWFIQHGEYTNPDGRRSVFFCPQWADGDGGLLLSELLPGHAASPYGVMASLAAFDEQAGYPFAWYFYMLHGNRVGSSAGGLLAGAILDGRINPLPECDTRVLLRWNEDRYGF